MDYLFWAPVFYLWIENYSTYRVEATWAPEPILTWWRSEQDGHCMYSVTRRRVRVNSGAVEKQSVLNILSVCL